MALSPSEVSVLFDEAIADESGCWAGSERDRALLSVAELSRDMYHDIP